MAVFGVPFVHEDDALRAVRAATEMREAVEVLNREFERDAGVSLAHRIGINTGEVVAADSATGDRIVTGDAVNVAARLEQTAGSKEILLGEATYRLVRDAVDAEGIEPVQARGKAEPIAAFRLIGVVAGAVGVTRRLDAELVGRKSELRLLATLSTVQGGTGPASCSRSSVRRASGSHVSSRSSFQQSGRTRDTSREGGVVLGDGITYWPIVDDDHVCGPTSRRHRCAGGIRAKITALLDGIREAHVITGAPCADPRSSGTTASPEETSVSPQGLLEPCRYRPAVVEFDDLELAEPTLLDLVEHIADRSRDARILPLSPRRGRDLLDLSAKLGRRQDERRLHPPR